MQNNLEDKLLQKLARKKRKFILKQKRFQGNNVTTQEPINESTMAAQINLQENNEVYMDLGDLIYECPYCKARMWLAERVKNESGNSGPTFSLCCTQGKTVFPLMQQPPDFLKEMLFSTPTAMSRHYLKNIRAYNSMFSFTSMGGTVDNLINNGSAPYIFKLHGQNYHRIDSLLPSEGEKPKFAQLYIFDTENEVQNRLEALSSNESSNMLDRVIVESLKKMIDSNNPIAQSFRMFRDRFPKGQVNIGGIKLLGRRDKDARMHNLPTASEVAALIVGDVGELEKGRDIIVETKGGILKRIREDYPSFLALQYPLLFVYGEDGFTLGVLHRKRNGKLRKREHVSMRDFFAFRIQTRTNEALTILMSRRLFQQFIVDVYSMIESQRLLFFSLNQKNFRANMYRGVTDAILQGDTDPTMIGKRVILPSSFTGSPKYMVQNFQDAMAICKWAGYPDLFITVTCNKNWPEIRREVDRLGLQPEDRLDIIARIFKLKVKQLMDDLKKRQIFGPIRAVVYTIEFQKRGLPHVHILLFLETATSKLDTCKIDDLICAEIPDKEVNPKLYETVMNCMIHGPCGEKQVSMYGGWEMFQVLSKEVC